MKQGSAEWAQLRVGKVTASRMSDVLARGRSGAPSATRAAYLGELIAERITGQPASAFTGNPDTERGLELEPVARAVYEVRTGRFVDLVGSIDHPRIAMASASPDGSVGADGLLEVKCPRAHTHLDYLLSGEPPAKYLPQMAWQAVCCERMWVDFVSYCPAMPEELKLFVVRYVPPADYMRELEAAVVEFLGEIDAKLARLAKLRTA